MSSKTIQGDLDAFEIDAGLTYLDNEPLSHVRRLPLYEERYLFATAAQGALGSRARITWREAAQQRLCLLLGEEGLSVKEAAEQLRIPRGTLYEEIKRIRKVFSDHGLDDYLRG